MVDVKRVKPYSFLVPVFLLQGVGIRTHNPQVVSRTHYQRLSTLVISLRAVRGQARPSGPPYLLFLHFLGFVSVGRDCPAMDVDAGAAVAATSPALRSFGTRRKRSSLKNDENVELLPSYPGIEFYFIDGDYRVSFTSILRIKSSNCLSEEQ